jgi:hypothetical protein
VPAAAPILKPDSGTGHLYHSHARPYGHNHRFLSPESFWEPECEDSAINTRIITTTKPPAKYLVFLWLFWKTFDDHDDLHRSYRIQRNRRSYYGLNVRRWLQWLEELASRPLSRRILNFLTSKCEVWLSGLFSGGRCGRDEDTYLSWISSVAGRNNRTIIPHVSRLDWEHAQRTVESAVALDQGTVEGGVSGSQDYMTELPFVVALYLLSHPDRFGSPRVCVLNDIGTIRTFVLRYARYCSNSRVSYSEHPLTLAPTAMIEFRSALQAAHPMCCHRLGFQVVDWYSASIAFLGLTDSVDHSKWRCKRCTSCKVTSTFRTLVGSRGRLRDISKQQLFDAAVSDLVSTSYCATKGPLYLQ